MNPTTRCAAVAFAIVATALAGPLPDAPPGVHYELPGPPTAAQATDVDADGSVDLVVAASDGPRIVVLRGLPGGDLGPWTPIADLPEASGSRLLGLAAVDLDLDGDTDLVGAGTVPTLWLAVGDGSFVPRPLLDRAASHVATADLDRDGDLDVLAVTAAGLSVLANGGGGSLSELETHPLDAVWPVGGLEVEDDGIQPVRVTAWCAAAGAELAWTARADGTLEPLFDDTPARHAVAPKDVLLRADLDGDSAADEVVAAGDGAAALVVRWSMREAARESVELVLRSGLLRTGPEGARILVRARLPESTHELPNRVAVGDPAAPFTVDLDSEEWSTDGPEVDVWRGGDVGSRIAVVVDRGRGTVTFSAARVALAAMPESPFEVETALQFDTVRAVQRSQWKRNRRGDLVYRLARTAEPGSGSEPASGRSPSGVERLGGGFDVETRMVDGETVTLLRDRRSGRTWRQAPDGTWQPVDAAGRFVVAAKPPTRTVRLVFDGVVDGSDVIRIDAQGATWTNRFWGTLDNTVALGGVEWAPRRSPKLPNQGATRFLPEGVDFSTGRLAGRSGRDLLAFEAFADHVTVSICDSPNGPDRYQAVMEFQAQTTSAGADAPALDRGLLAHLPLSTGVADTASPGTSVEDHGVTFEGGAARFDGNATLTLPHIDLANRPFAFSLQVRVDGDAESMGLVEQRAANAGSRHLHLMLRTGQRPYLGFYLNDLIADRPVPRDGRFHHLVFQFTGEEQEIWMDGERVAHRRSGPYLGDRGATHLGRNPGWTNVGRTHLVGGLRDVRVYGRALTASEITALAR